VEIALLPLWKHNNRAIDAKNVFGPNYQLAFGIATISLLCRLWKSPGLGLRVFPKSNNSGRWLDSWGWMV